MIKFIVYLIFILSVAFAAGGIILSSRLRNRYKSEIFSSLLYFQVFIYTFGFYVVWGQVLIKAFLMTYLSGALLEKISNISILLGLPFLIFGWLMLIQFSRSLSGRKNSKLFIVLFLVANFSVLLLLGYYSSGKEFSDPASLIRGYYIIMNLIHSFIAAYLIHFPVKERCFIHEYDSRIIAPSIFLSMLIQCSLLYLCNDQPLPGIIFIFVFFSFNTFLPVWLTYGTAFSEINAGSPVDITMEEFCRRFEVSPRESDIIREICNGLSNKEISEKLFISLQTVKDHTHRIYIKTNVRSRVQLITLFKELSVKQT